MVSKRYFINVELKNSKSSIFKEFDKWDEVEEYVKSIDGTTIINFLKTNSYMLKSPKKIRNIHIVDKNA